MNLANKKALVTGAGGFIGSHLVERLAAMGCAVRCLVEYDSRGDIGWLDDIAPTARAAAEIVAGDLRDGATVRRAVAGVDAVFHLGALIAIPYSYVNPDQVVATNVLGTLNVLTAARDHGTARVVHTSTSEVYGTARRVPISEDHPLQGQSPYSASKIGADKLAESFHAAFGLPVATLRPFNTYGPRQSARAVIPTIVTQALAGKTVRLGALTPTRDLTYVSDTVEAFIKIAESDAAVGGTFNAGTGQEISIDDLARCIARLVGREIEIVNDPDRLRPAASEVERLCADATRAERTFGWRPRATLDEGLTRTIEWIKANLDRYRVGEYMR